MIRWKRYREMLRAGEPARRARLTAEGRVLDVGELDPGAEVIRIALGFGEEFWQVEPGYRLDLEAAAIVGGRLIVKDGERVTDAAKLAFLQRRIEQIVYSA